VATFEDQTVRIAEVAADTDAIVKMEFERCTILGPAVLIPSGSRFFRCSFAGTPEDLIWDIDPNRDEALGGIWLENCSFTECAFVRIGFGFVPERAQEFREALGESVHGNEPVAR
jgi:hypothetical protein